MHTPHERYKQTRLAAQQGKQISEAADQQWSQKVQEFQSFYQENLNLIYRYIYSKVENREDAEDLRPGARSDERAALDLLSGLRRQGDRFRGQ